MEHPVLISSNIYSLVIRRHGDPVLGPLARQVDAHARHDGRRVPQAHRGQVQAAKALKLLNSPAKESLRQIPGERSDYPRRP